MSFVSLNIEYFPDPTRGVPVYKGYVYIGEPDTDPEVPGNQVPVTLRLSDGSTVAAIQPIRTGAGGVALYNGSPVQLLVPDNYSLKVLDKLQVQVYYVANAFGFVAGDPVFGVGLLLTGLKALTTLSNGVTVVTSGRLSFGDHGGGVWVWSSSDLSSEVSSDPLSGLYAAPLSEPSGASGAWVRQFSTEVNVSWFGGDIQAAIDLYENVYIPSGLYVLTSPIAQTRKNIIRGSGLSTVITSTTTDLFHVGGSDWSQSEFSHMSLVSDVGGGHVFFQQGLVKGYDFHHLFIEQKNDAKSIYQHINDLGNYIGNVWRKNVYFHTYTATAPGFHFKVSASTGATNSNVWKESELVRGSKPWFYFESNRSYNYIYDVVLKDLVCEVTKQGIFKGFAVNGLTVDNVRPYDLIAHPEYDVTASMFTLTRGTNAANVPSRNISIKNYNRADSDAALNGNYDLQILAASGAGAVDITIMDSLRTQGLGLLLDLDTAQDILVLNTRYTASGVYFNLTSVLGSGIETDRFNLATTYITIEDLVFPASLHNYAVAASTSLIRCTTDGLADKFFTGITAPSDATNALTRVLYIANVDPVFNIALTHNTSSVATNRFYCPNGVTFIIPPFGGAYVFYDKTAERWQVMAQ